jgi:methionine-rich copper-binding protein CopC
VSRPLRRAALLVATALVALGGWAVAASPASAHNTLRSTSPADHSTVDAVPAEIVLTFDETAVAMGTEIVVTGPSGPVSAGAAQLVDNTVRQSIAAGAPAGAYTVQWRVTSADGHPVTGTFAFTARAAGGGSAGATSTASAEQTGSVGPTGSAEPSASVGPTGGAAETPSGGRAGVPTWVWPVIAAALLLSALTSAAAARRRNRRSH